MRDGQGQTNGIYVHRLKSKWGTKVRSLSPYPLGAVRKPPSQGLPTAELSVSGAIGHLVGEPGHGVRVISSVLNITRLHSAISCISALGRCLAIAKAFAGVRWVGGQNGTLLCENEMHTSALATSEIVHRALIQLSFGTIALLGRSEALGEKDLGGGEGWRLRLLTPVVKAFAADLSTGEMGKCMEALGGQGYMEENEFGR
jgi:alkylation response protein AidB-like acyl-CoA dehydrogenase